MKVDGMAEGRYCAAWPAVQAAHEAFEKARWCCCASETMLKSGGVLIELAEHFVEAVTAYVAYERLESEKGDSRGKTDDQEAERAPEG